MKRKIRILLALSNELRILEEALPQKGQEVMFDKVDLYGA